MNSRFGHPEKDQRIVYGATCTWWDTIDQVGQKVSGLPCCPHCGGVLFEMPNAREWWKPILAYEADGHPGYHDLMRWMQGQCFPNFEAAEKAFKETPFEKLPYWLQLKRGGTNDQS